MAQSTPVKVNKISVLHKMFGLAKKKAVNSYIVPQNSTINLEQKPGLRDHINNLTENTYDRNAMNKCPHCENMAKNFLYLESLIRNNCDKHQKCSLCQSSLKYLQYVNRNIMQVFGNFDSIVQAARVFSTQAPPAPKYAVRKQADKQLSQRAEGGAVVGSQKSSKSLKSQKSKKSLKSQQSLKSGKSKSKSKAGLKSHTGHGKMVLKSKYKQKANKLASHLSKVVRSVSQHKSLHPVRSKLKKHHGMKSMKSKRHAAPPTSINWSLLKRNLPKRKALGAK
ncbi:CG3330 [Drosophila busckii]|uniref:CG3330 n=1 Tax=Drosophila busckii TaxID=30019 RepID=A0A0M4F329_DROBS|nr:uncharacterized protein LOC108602313 [Drosophila busckii]ALC45570.1 CG3330 [Drosophila busckii]